MITNKFFIATLTDRESKKTYFQDIYKTLDAALTYLAIEIIFQHYEKGIEEIFVNIHTVKFGELGKLESRETDAGIEYYRGTMLNSSVLENDVIKVSKLLDTIFVDRKYNVQTNIGKAKYVLNTYDGFKEHPDGSEFWDIEIFSNKKKLNKAIKELKDKGYTHRLF